MPSCNDKKCPDGKICNPLTGRCIKIKAPKPFSCNDKKCPDGKICNPITLRCIKNDSKNKRKKQSPIKRNMNDKLYFYSKSKDVAPGKGANEIVEDANIYADLAKYKDWRKVLSNFHVCPFKYDGYTYNTIEHVFQAKKTELKDKEKAFLFTLESGNEIGLGDGEIARKNRKIVKLNDEELKVWGHMKDQVMHDAAVAKYKACKEARDVLKATNNAQLWHIVSRSKPVRFEHLEKIREKL